MELIQFGIIPLTNHPSFPDRKGRVIDNAAAQFIKDGFMTVNAGGKLCQEPIPIGASRRLRSGTARRAVRREAISRALADPTSIRERMRSRSVIF